MASDVFNEEATPAGDAYYQGKEPPFEGFVIPPFFHSLVQTFTNKKLLFSTPSLYGGFTLRQYIGMPPNDYDVYVSAPTIVAKVREILNKKISSYKDRDENEDELDGVILPHFSFLNQSCDYKKLRAEPSRNDGFSIHGGFLHDNQAYTIDLKVMTLDLPVGFISRSTPASILSPVVSLDENGNPFYAYHKDFEKHAKNRELHISNTNPNYVESLCKKFGMTPMPLNYDPNANLKKPSPSEP